MANLLCSVKSGSDWVSALAVYNNDVQFQDVVTFFGVQVRAPAIVDGTPKIFDDHLSNIFDKD